MKRLILITIIAILGVNSFAQISHGGRPLDWEGKSARNLDFEKLSAPDREELAMEDAVNDQYKHIPYRFGVEYEVDFDSENNGTWNVLGDGTRVWRLGISAPGALTLNFDFDVYDIPDGAKVFVYDPAQRQVVGSFTNQNASKQNSLGVGLLSSDKIIIEYIEPSSSGASGYLHINKVVYGYRSVLDGLMTEAKAGPFGDSGPCNIDVNCADLEIYESQKRSVALIVGGGSICSGVVVNNTALDQHPYFLTANHCLPSDLNGTQNWVFYFNHEIPECGGSDDEAPVNQSVSGGSVLARSTASDFALLEFNENIPPSYQVCYAGWDATDFEVSVNSAYGIHHPSGDVKKICFEEDAPYRQIQPFEGNPNTQMWWIDQWEEGVTEGGSSGSPLFNQNGLIIGQLAGGAASCFNTNGYDFYGRFGVAWDFGATAESRLSDWLDPAGTGQLILPNSCSGSAPENDLTLGSFGTDEFLYCFLETIDESLTVVNTGSNDITSFVLGFSINGEVQDNIEWSGTLGSFQSETVDLGDIQLVEGDNNVSVEVITVNGGDDANDTGNQQSKDYLATNNALTINLTIQFDDFPTETSWRIIDENENTLYSGGGYGENENQLQEELCLPEGCYSFVIEDSWGDGICCGEGEGYFLLQDGNLDTLAIGGEFDDVAVELFCAEPLSTLEHTALRSISVYPNPAQNFVNIDLGEIDKPEQVVVSDLLGRVVYNQVGRNADSQILRIETAGFQSGVYLIQIKTEFGIATRKVVVE